METRRNSNRTRPPRRRPGGPGADSRAAARTQASGRRRRKRRGNKVLHYLLLLVFLGTVGTVLSMTVFFKIERVEVVGVDRYAPDQIALASGVVEGDNLLRIDKPKIEAAILEKFPYIDRVIVHRKIPSGVEIEVIQAEPIGAILQGDEVLLIDAQGKVLERGVIMAPDEVPIVKGIDAGGAKPGEILGAYTAPPQERVDKDAAEEELKELEAEEKAEQEKRKKAEEIQEKLRMLRTLLDAVKATEFTGLTNVDLSDRLNMKVMYENRITLELGVESELEYKLDFIRHVLESDIAPDERGTLDATDAARSRVIFSPESAKGSTDQTIVIDRANQGEEEGDSINEPQ